MRSSWSALLRSSLASDAMLSLAFTLLSLGLFLIYGTPDQEEYQLSVFSSLIRFRSLWAGHWPYWLWDYGFGTPLPLGHSFDWHPFFLASPVVPFALLYGTILTAHLWAGTYFLIVFLRNLQVDAIVARVAAFCFALSTPVLNFTYSDDWPSCLIAYSLVPILLVLIKGIVDAPDRRRLVLHALLLGIAAGFFLVKGHPGHTSVLGVGLAVYAAASAGPRARPWTAFAGAAVIALLMASETAFYLRTEMLRFPSGLERMLQQPLAPSDYLLALARPLWPGFFRDLLRGDWLEGYRRFVAANSDTRKIFMGAAFGLGAIASLALLPRADIPGGRRNLIAVLLALAVSVWLSLTDAKASGGFASAGYLFRDNVVVFATIAASLVLTSIRTAGWTRLVAALLVLQVCQAALSAYPAMVKPMRMGTPGLFPEAGRVSPLAQRIARSADTYGRRIYLGPDAYRRLRGKLSGEGVYAVTDLVLAGLAPVNGWFKNVSMDQIAPSPMLMHGMIIPDAGVISDQPLLDVSGIDLVLLSATDLSSARPAPGLEEVDRWTSPGDSEFHLFANPQAWPNAVLMAPEAATRLATLARRPGCSAPGLQCADLSGAAALRFGDPVKMQTSSDAADFSFPVADSQRLLVTSVLARPEWRAEAGGTPANTVTIAGAFVGIPIPPGVTHASLRYDAAARRVLLLLGLATAAIAGLAAAGLALAGRRSRTSLRRSRGARNHIGTRP